MGSGRWEGGVLTCMLYGTIASMSSWIVCILAVILEDEYAVSVGDYGHIAW